jgi:hypothetical protein
MAILPGTYEDHLFSDNGSDAFNNWGPGLPSGTASQPTVIKAANGPGTVVLQHDGTPNLSPIIGLDDISYVVLDGLILDKGSVSFGVGNSGRRSHHITFQNGEIAEGSVNGLSDYLQVINNKLHDGGARRGGFQEWLLLLAWLQRLRVRRPSTLAGE